METPSAFRRAATYWSSTLSRVAVSASEAMALTRASAKSTGGVRSAVILKTTRPSGVAAEGVTRLAESESGERVSRNRSEEGAAASAADPQPDGDIRLTPTEWHLLEVLLRNPGKLLSHRQLLNEVWGPGYDNAGGNLRLYMAQLRRKLERDPARPRWLITEPGMGYRYQPPSASETAV